MAKKKKYTPAELMQLAIDESRKSIPEHTDKTDPLVGAIVTTPDGEILAKAHRGELRVGQHCEYTLLEKKLGHISLTGNTLYVTLEPCTDQSRNSSKGKKGCASHIVSARLGKVYVGIEDPNPKIATEGIKFLESKGITVEMFPPELGDVIRGDNAQFIKEKEEEALHAKRQASQPLVSVLDQPVDEISAESLSPDAVQEFIKRSGAEFTYPSKAFNEWAQEFGFLEKETTSERLRPTGLGILLFGKHPEKQFPSSVFKVEINYGTGEPEIRDFNGPLVLQLPKIIEFVKDKALKLTMDRSQGARTTNIDFPFEVIREAIGNAFIHRDYTHEGATNYLYIDPEKVIVRSPGVPMLPLTIDDLKAFKAPSLSRNPKIMYVFNQMKLAEQRGVGLRDMKMLPEKGFQQPSIELRAGMLEVTFSRATSIFRDAEAWEWEAFLFIQKNGSVTAGQYASVFKLNPKTAQRRLNRLEKAGVVIKEGQKRGTRFRVK